jgi:hypothetical protein
MHGSDKVGEIHPELGAGFFLLWQMRVYPLKCFLTIYLPSSKDLDVFDINKESKTTKEAKLSTLLERSA